MLPVNVFTHYRKVTVFLSMSIFYLSGRDHGSERFVYFLCRVTSLCVLCVIVLVIVVAPFLNILISIARRFVLHYILIF